MVKSTSFLHSRCAMVRLPQEAESPHLERTRSTYRSCFLQGERRAAQSTVSVVFGCNLRGRSVSCYANTLSPSPF